MTDERIDKLIESFKNLMQYDMLGVHSHAYDDMRKELEKQIENRLKGVHKNKIFRTKDGRYKTHNPEMIKTNKIDLMIALYEYYFHEKPEVIPKKRTIKYFVSRMVENL